MLRRTADFPEQPTNGIVRDDLYGAMSRDILVQPVKSVRDLKKE